MLNPRGARSKWSSRRQATSERLCSGILFEKDPRSCLLLNPRGAMHENGGVQLERSCLPAAACSEPLRLRAQYAQRDR